MALIYNIGIYFYRMLIGIVSIFNDKAKLWIGGRKHWRENLEEATKNADHVFWFHAASLGEFEQGRPLIEKIKAEQKDVFILLTFFSPSGYEIQKNYAQADYVCYLPSDTLSNAKDFVAIAKPEQAFFIKYEFWFNYMSQLKKQSIPLYLVSGIFREKQIFFKFYGGWFRKQLRAFTYFYVQDQASQEKLKKIGYDNAQISGDTRFDRVIEIAEQSVAIDRIEQFRSEQPCMVIGSSWPKDEELLADYINTHPDYQYILAPHEIKESHLVEIESRLNIPFQRWSAYQKQADEETSLIIIDNIGLLSRIYKYADIAYIGGAFGTGLHNILEAAVYGVPVVFGPEYSKFQEAKDLLEKKGAYSISNKNDLFDKLDMLFNDSSKRKQKGENAKAFIYKSKGAAELIYRNIFS